jgi:CDGSH-type Zn-finger protein/uncharacterized Fe-S cluster protein YjdI
MTVKSKIRTYHGEKIEVTYDRSRCIHAAECVRGLPVVFDTQQRPWVQPDAGSADKIAAVVGRCPSGALQFTRHDGGSTEVAPAKNVITPTPDGPLYLHGEIEILDSEGKVILSDTRLALCRCGASGNKPFCDGTHYQVAFQDPGVLQENSLGSNEATLNGKLQVRPTPNGPLLLQGEVEVCGATGQTCFSGNKGALCRCGGSQNKPFCDGTHVQLGFEAE